MNSVQGKRLLILGGSLVCKDIIEAARELGVYTVVTDWYEPERSPAKLLADEYSMTSVADMDALQALIEEKKIDGVITGFTDSYLPYYEKLCARMNWPCYLSEKTLGMTLDKAFFKETCERYGIGIIPGFYCANEQDLERVDFASWGKALVKPLDNSGSRGISICTNTEELCKAYHHALEFSDLDRVLVERYMDCDDVSLAYVLRDGEIRLSAICDRSIYVTETGGSVTSGLIYPSRYLARYRQEVDEKVKYMLREMGFTDGVLFLQLFVDEAGFYFYEMGQRLSGGRHYIFTNHINHASVVRMLIEFALGGETAEEFSRENAEFDKLCCQVSVLCRSAEIGTIRGLDKLEAMPEVVDCCCYYQPGETVGAEGTSAQIAMCIHVSEQDLPQLRRILERVKQTLCVEDCQGNDMIQSFFLP